MIADPSTRTGYVAWQVSHVMGVRTEKALRPLGLTTAQHNALLHVARTPGISPADIARRTGITPQSMGAAVNALVDRGLLERRPHPTSRRTVRLAITETGEALALRAQETMTRADDEAVSVLTPDERASLHTLLLRLLVDLNPDAVPPADDSVRPEQAAGCGADRDRRRDGAPPGSGPAPGQRTDGERSGETSLPSEPMK
ncbi:MarR family winged helix-turn-helix transcriptional regulator [Streptomyces sp. NPDC017936]|uniref:MarR family winged helix-turn-helix transcriptional regulator n=1 Tax=Streptomyces sp. NPDC017936 TaxID=3365016 RepID=UPI0037A7526E